MPNDKKHNWVQIVKESYNKIARQFSFSRHYNWADTAVFLDYIKKGDKVVDLGCGNGRLTEQLPMDSIEYFGIDQSEGLIHSAQKHYSDFNFQVMNILNLELDDSSQDVLLAVAAVNHLPQSDHEKFFAEANRVLKSGGYLLMSNWNMWSHDNPKNIYKFHKKIDEMSDSEFLDKYGIEKQSVGPRDVITLWGEEYQLLFYYAFDVEELQSLAEKAGFSVIKNYYSKKDEQSTKDLANNILTVLQKK